MESLFSWIGLSAVLFFSFVKAGKVADDTFNDVSRRQFSCWLLNAQPERKICEWASAFAHLFDSVFGTRHISPKCFSRSAVASVLAVGLCLFVGRGFYIELLNSYGWSADIALLAICGVLANIVIDYISLLETRVAVNAMKRQKRSIARHAVLVGDLLLTSAGSALVFFLVMFFVGVMDFVSDPSVDDPVLLLVLAPFAALDMLFVEVFRNGFLAVFIDALRASERSDQIALAPLLWSTYFTSVWLWLFLVATGINRFGSWVAAWIGTWHHLAIRHLKIEEKPFSVVGFICGMVAAVVSAIAILYVAATS